MTTALNQQSPAAHDDDLESYLRALFDVVRHRRDIWVPLSFTALGFTPIACLTLALFGIAPLHHTAVAVVLPSIAMAIALCIYFPRYGRIALRGYAIALVGVLLYDATRVPWILTGLWTDFIPRIGALLLDRQEESAALGYTWRWMGNGGGMGLAFFMAYPLISRRIEVCRAGLTYGVLIWTCLILTLQLAPQGQALLFPITLKTLVFSFIGHVVFGAVIGGLMRWTGLNVRPYTVDSPARPSNAAVSAIWQH
jgi:hypothetical protein